MRNNKIIFQKYLFHSFFFFSHEIEVEIYLSVKRFLLLDKSKEINIYTVEILGSNELDYFST